MIEKPCYSCHQKFPLSELEDMGVWVCKDCLKPEKKKPKPKKDEK